MKYLPFGASGIEVSALGFGCGPMGSRFGARESRRAMDTALDCGVTMFDTARVYGHGDAEGILGRFMQGRRDRIVLSTKFGLHPGTSSAAKRLVKAVGRQVVKLVPGAMAMATQQARTRLGAQLSRGTFSAAEMKVSVERSLTELRTDYVDVLFLHSCPAEVARDDELFAALEALVQEGKARCIGVASSAAVIVEVLRARSGRLGAVQFHQSLLAQDDAETLAAEVQPGRVGTMAHQPFGGPDGIGRVRAALDGMRRDEALSASLREKLASGDPDLFADLALNGVLRNTGVNVAVCAMYTVAHIRSNSRVVAASRFTDSEIGEAQRYFRNQAREVSS